MGNRFGPKKGWACFAAGTLLFHQFALAQPAIPTESPHDLRALQDRLVEQAVGSGEVVPGGASIRDGSLSLSAKGGDIWSGQDRFRFVHFDATGDFAISGRVLLPGDAPPWAKVGFMIRVSPEADAAFVMAAFTPGNGAVMLSRTTTRSGTELDREPDWKDAPSGPQSKWLRLVRTGDIISAYTSESGTDWQWIGTQRSALPETALVGLAISGHSDASAFSAEVDTISFEKAPVSENTSDTLLGGGGLLGHYFNHPYLAGAATARTDGQINFDWTDGAPHEDLSPDRFSVRWDGDLQVPHSGLYTFYLASDDRARMRLGEDWIINERAQHGFEESQAKIHLEAGRRYPVHVQYFEDQGNAAIALKWSSERIPKQLIPADNLFPAPPEVLESRPVLPTVANVPLPDDMQSWTATRIGSFAGEFRVERAGQGILLSSAGDDIWTHLDSFSFLHAAAGASVEISARVVMVDAWHPWAKVGLMIREDASEDAANALVAVTPLSGVTAQRREESGGPTLEDGGGQGGAPVYLKLRRNGEVFTSYRSTDGVQWEWIATQRISMGDACRVGLAVSSHDPEKLCRAYFDQIQVTTPAAGVAASGFTGNGDGLQGDYTAAGDLKLQRVDARIDFDWRSGGPFGDHDQDDFQSTWTGLIEAQFSEPYRLHVLSDDGARLWLDGELVLDAWRDRAASKSSVSVPLKAGHKYLAKLEYYEGTGLASVQLRWSSPSTPEQIVPGTQLYSPAHAEFARILDRDGDLIPDRWEELHGLDWAVRADAGEDWDGDGLTNYEEYLHGANPRLVDSDGDGLPDGWEVRHGLNPADPTDGWQDHDSDGLTNREEFAAGTNPRAVDSDGDGLDDHTELAESGTDPTADDHVALMEVWELPGTAATRDERWFPIEDGALRSNGRRGVAEYPLPVARADVYRVEIQVVTKAVGLSARNDELVVEVNGLQLLRRRLSHEVDVPQTIVTFTPWLQPGDHRLRVRWDNVVAGRIIAIRSVKLQALEGTDTDGDGIKDWVESRLARHATITTLPTESVISPAFIEGTDLYPSLVRVSQGDGVGAAVATSSERGWFANIALDPDAATEVLVEFQGGVSTAAHAINWKPLEVLSGGELTVRAGDSLLLAAQLAGVRADDEKARLLVNGEVVHEGMARDRVPFAFPTTGTYLIEGQLLNDSGSVSLSGTVTVKVVDYQFPNEPAALVGRARNWSLPKAGESVQLAVSAGVQLERLPGFADEDQMADRLSLRASTPDESVVIARLGVDGPILDRTLVRGVRIASAGDTTLRVRETYADGSDLFEMCTVSSPVLPDVQVRMHVIVGGVVFDDGSLARIVAAGDFDRHGENHVRFIRARGADHSTCHVTRIFQGDEFIGPYISEKE